MSSNQYDTKRIINLGLGKIGSTQITTYENPRSPIERFVSEGYPHWRDDELTSRRWVFAMERVKLTQSGPKLDDAFEPLVYQFALPEDMMQPVRQKRSEWEVRGKKLYASADTVWLEYVARKDEQMFTPAFREVLACRIALECAEFVTQSNTKKADALTLYNQAVTKAGRLNAFIIGSDDVETPDDLSEWTAARWG